MRLAQKRGYSVAGLERRAGLANGLIRKWRKPTAMPSAYAVAKLAEVLEVTADELINGG